jgi:peptidyl-prolyl cis-trans isomerase B (cyclophilin B)
MFMFKRYGICLLGLLLIFTCSCNKDKKDWREARTSKTITGFEKYLREHPDGDFAVQAQGQIAWIEFGNAKDSRSIVELKYFISQYPDSTLANQANRLMWKYAHAKQERLTLEEMANCSIVVETSGGNFEFRLLPHKAPGHCRNIIKLAYLDYYNGQTINSVRPDKWIRMGDQAGNGMGGPGYMIKAEINDAPLQRWSVMMWHLENVPDSAGSQFFVFLDVAPELEGKYTIFGEVSDGMDAMENISRAKTHVINGRGTLKPDPPVLIKKVWVRGFDLDQKIFDSDLATIGKTNTDNNEGESQ